MLKNQRVSASKRGYGYQWQQARKSYLDEHPLCVMCLKLGSVSVGTVVDHIQPHQGDRQKFWDKDNWQTLCATHHDSAKQRIESGKAVHGFDKHGRRVVLG